jgi:predicted transcriptional regulator
MDDIFGRLQQELERRERNFSPLDLLELSPLERKAMNLFLRHGHLSLAEVADMLEMEREAAQFVLNAFVEKKWLLEFQLGGEQHYRPLFARKRARKMPPDIWTAIEELIE